jgi:hypothetical protein
MGPARPVQVSGVERGPTRAGDRAAASPQPGASGGTARAPDSATGSGAPAVVSAARPPTELAIQVALVIALVGLLQGGAPPRVAVLSLIAVTVTLAASARWRIGPVAVVVLLMVGVALRLVPSSGVSDVLAVTEAAIREALAGGNPYGHGYEQSVPPGAPYPYGPLALLWYLPSLAKPGRMETLGALVVLGLLAVRGRTVGLAVYAVTPALVIAAGDGSDDTSAGLLLLLTLLVAVRVPLAGAVLLALTVAFKPYALAWLPGLLAYGGYAWPLAAFLITSLIVWLPASMAWGPESMVWSFRAADDLHARPYYSLAYGLDAISAGVAKPVWDALRVAAGVGIALLNLVCVRSAAGLILGGTLVFLATLFLGWWGTFAYLSAVAPVLCWNLDDWLGLGRGRVAWPADPVRTVTTWADTRWPVRSAHATSMEHSAGGR